MILNYYVMAPLALYREQGHNVFMAIAIDGSVGVEKLSNPKIAQIRNDEQVKSCSTIDVKMIWMSFEDEWFLNDKLTRVRFLDVFREANPDIVFVHSANDYIADHRISSKI